MESPTDLKLSYSHETCVAILRETAVLYREDDPFRWFLLLNRIFHQLVENPELYDAETVTPVFETISSHAQKVIDAVASGDLQLVLAHANGLTEAYCGLR